MKTERNTWTRLSIGSLRTDYLSGRRRPVDVVEERGYPQLTEQAKRKILGENLAHLHGIDVEEKRAALGAAG